MVTPALHLDRLDLGDVRRRAAPVAERLLLNTVQLDELLNPVRHHPSGLGERRARQLLDAYNHFREGTIDQVVASAGIPRPHLDTFERDLTQRVEQVNQSFRLLACHAVAELTDPTPPAPPQMVRSGVRMGPGVNHHFGSESALGLAEFTVGEMNRKANHFWASVLNRVRADCDDRYRAWDDDMDDDDDDDDYADLY